MRQTGRTQNHTGTQQSADTPAPDTLRVPGPRPAGVVRSRPRRAAAEGRRSVRHLDNDGGLHREVIRLTQEAAEQVWASVREAKRLLARARRSRARAVGVSKRARARVLWQLSELIPWPNAWSRRSASVSLARRSATGWSHSSTPTFAPSGAASWPPQPVRLRGPTDRVDGQHQVGCQRSGLASQAAAWLDPRQHPPRRRLRKQRRRRRHGWGRSPGLHRRQIQERWLRRTRRCLACYRVGAEGRISQLKRKYGARRSRLKRERQERASGTNWSVLTYNPIPWPNWPRTAVSRQGAVPPRPQRVWSLNRARRHDIRPNTIVARATGKFLSVRASS